MSGIHNGASVYFGTIILVFDASIASLRVSNQVSLSLIDENINIKFNNYDFTNNSGCNPTAAAPTNPASFIYLGGTIFGTL